MRITVDQEMVFLHLTAQEDGFLSYVGGLVDTVINCEQDGHKIRPLISQSPPFYIIPRNLLPSFLRYAAHNPQEIELQKMIADTLGETDGD